MESQRKKAVDKGPPSAIDALPAVVVEADIASRTLTSVSQGVRELLGYEPRELAGDVGRVRALLHPDDCAAVERALTAAAKESGEARVELRVVTRDGRLRWLRADLRRCGADGHERLVALVQDVTDDLQAARRIAVQEALTAVLAGAATLEAAGSKVLETLCESFGWEVGCLWLFPPGTQTLRFVAGWNSALVDAGRFFAASERLALEAGDGLLGEVFERCEPVWRDDILRDRRFVRRREARAAGLHAAMAFPVVVGGRPGGVLEFFATSSRAPDAALTRLMAAFGLQIGQLVERLAAEQARRASEARSRAYLEAALDCVVIADREGRVLEFNPAAEQVFGYTREEALGKRVADLIVPPALRRRHLDAFARFVETRQGRMIGQRLELTAMRADGSEFPVELALSSADGEELVVCGALRDISGRKRAEEALQRSERNYRLLFEEHPHPMCVFDRETRRLLAVNAAMVAGYGYDRGELLAMTVADLAAPGEAERLEEALGGRQPGYAAPTPWRLRTKAGEELDVELSLHDTIFDGRPAEIALMIDVTQRHRLEEQLRRSQKLQAIGQLAAGIAHDFNNILAVVRGYADLIAERAGDASLAAAAREIQQAAEGAAGLTRQLLAFSRRQVLAVEELDLNEVVRKLRPLLERLIPADIRLSLSLHDRPCIVRADRSQLEQILLNLVLNACDAIEGAGAIRIETSTATVGAPTHPDLEPGAYATLAVSDTGAGMDEATRERIFEPFFTTKTPGNGSGLGLATVYGIVEQSGGAIWVYSEPGMGSVFRVYLPLAGAAEAPPARQELRAPTRDTTVLVVDDNASLRRLLAAALEEDGYRVLTAPNAETAFELLGPAGADLLITDLVLPGRNGRELAREATARFPKLRTLFTSGYAEETLAERGLGSEVRFLPKPFDLATLRQAVREALAGD